MQSGSRAAARAVLFGSWLVVAAAQADVTITQLANEGAVIASGDTRIMIDGMVVEPYAVYGGLPADAVPQFQSASGAFADIDLALVSHRHHEHNEPAYACEFMQTSKSTILKSSSQVTDLMREKCRSFVLNSGRVETIAPQYFEPVVIEIPGASVTVFLLNHGTRKHDAMLENYGHLIEIGDMKVLHVGDAAMDPTDFERARLDQVKLDVALIPYLYFQPGPGAELVKDFLNATVKIAVHVPPDEMDEVVPYMEENFPNVLVLQPLQQVTFSSNVAASP